MALPLVLSSKDAAAIALVVRYKNRTQWTRCAIPLFMIQTLDQSNLTIFLGNELVMVVKTPPNDYVTDLAERKQRNQIPRSRQAESPGGPGGG